MYAEQDYETEVYQIFTPEVIQKTMQWFSSEGEFSKFEFIDKKIYFFVEKEIDTLEQFNTLLLSLRQLIDIFLPGIKSVDGGVRAMNEVYDSVWSKESKNDNSS